VERVIVFAKAPRLGQVKTRLAGEIGERSALDAYLELLRALFRGLASIPNVEVAFTPDDASADLAPLLPPGWRLRPQGEGDLGLRLQRAFERAFAEGAKRVITIGSDCPHVTTQHIRDAGKALDRADLVLGPATDGGYWLIGLPPPSPALFQNINWGTADVLAQTLAKARESRLKIDLLEILPDVDTAKDWKEYLRNRNQAANL
jgi:rSAM/selenodomain-associated transferase 1